MKKYNVVIYLGDDIRLHSTTATPHLHVFKEFLRLRSKITRVSIQEAA